MYYVNMVIIINMMKNKLKKIGRINKSGILIRIGADTLRVMGRATQGVKLIDLRGNDEIAAVTKVKREDEEEETETEGEEPAEKMEQDLINNTTEPQNPTEE